MHKKDRKQILPDCVCFAGASRGEWVGMLTVNRSDVGADDTTAWMQAKYE